MAVTSITWPDRVDAQSLPSSTSRFAAEEANEIKTAVNNNAAELTALQTANAATVIQTIQIPAATGTKNVDVNMNNGHTAVIGLEDGGSPVPVGDENYSINIPSNLVAGQVVRLIITNENASETIDLHYATGWQTKAGVQLADDTGFAASAVKVVECIAISTSILREA